MLAQRVLTAVVLVALLIGALLVSPLAFAALMAVAFALALAEWLQLAGWRSAGAHVAALAVMGGLVALLFLAPMWVNRLMVPLVQFATLVWLGLAALIVRAQRRGVAPVPPQMSSLAALVLVPAAWCALLLVLAAGVTTLLSLLVIVWLADTAAYFSGRAFGKTKLAPRISPGKTWAGVWGAVIIVTIAALVAWQLAPGLPLYSTVLLQRWGVIVTVLVLAVLVAVSIVGDLFESLLKRQAGAKDSGTLLPGHGGFFDRLDAMLALLPPAALVWTLT